MTIPPSRACLLASTGPISAGIAGGGGIGKTSVAAPVLVSVSDEPKSDMPHVLASGNAGPTSPVGMDVTHWTEGMPSVLSFRNRLLRIITVLPALKTIIERDFPFGVSLESLNDAELLTSMENALRKELAWPLHNVSEERMSLYQQFLTEIADDEDRKLLGELIGGDAHRERGLGGLVLAQWSLGEEAGQASLHSWIPLLFPETSEEVKSEVSACLGRLSKNLLPFQALSSSLSRDRAEVLADEAESDLIRNYQDVDIRLDAAVDELRTGVIPRDHILARLVSFVTILEAEGEIHRAELAKLLTNYPDIYEEISAERHNLGAMLRMVKYLVFSSTSNESLARFERTKNGSLDQAWQRPLQWLAVLDVKYTRDGEGRYLYQGRVPTHIIQGYKLCPVPDHKSISVRVEVDSQAHELHPQDQYQGIVPFLELRKLFVTVLSNAVKYCNLQEEEMGIIIKIRSMVPDQVAIFIEDNGLGYEDVDAALSGKRLLTREASGGGEGLPWGKRMVESVGGQFVIESHQPHFVSKTGGRSRHAVVLPKGMFR